MLRASVLFFSLALVACQSSPDEPAGRAPSATSVKSTASLPSSPPPPPVDPDSGRYLSALNAFCTITQEVKADATITDKEKPRAIVKRLLAREPPPAFLKTVQALGDLPPAGRYAALKAGAAEHGAPNWSCPALAGD